jgi:NAD(P)-dependent dehydrogenase (short-subunit alcohol dehydrogenase family)
MLSSDFFLPGESMLLDQQVTIVTGAGRGIGRAIALKFAGEGAAVIVTARSENEVQAVAAEIEKAGGRARAVVADVSREADCAKIVDLAREAFGPVHILVNNAGIFGPVKPVEEITPKEWDEVMGVNLRGPFLLSQRVLPEMYARGSGAIVNISTVAAKAAFPFNSPYAASKAGLLGLTRALAAEGARKGVRANAICPGPVTETKMSQDLTREFAARFQSQGDEVLQRMIDGLLQGRPQTTDEIAAAALFLASARSSAITGQTLNVDGGMVFY